MSNFDRSVHEALNRLRLALPEPSSPAGSYKPAVVAGELLFLSAQVPPTRAASWSIKAGSGRS